MADDVVAPTLPGIRRRLASMLYESLLLVGVIAVMVVPLVVYGAIATKLPSQAFVRVYIFLGLAGYFLWHWTGNRQTLAMRTWKIRISGQSNTCPPLWRFALRYIIAWPSIGSGLGVLWALFDRDKQFLHDRLAGTRIIFAPPTKS